MTPYDLYNQPFDRFQDEGGLTIPYSVSQGALVVQDQEATKKQGKPVYEPYYLVDFYFNNTVSYVNCFNIDPESVKKYKINKDLNSLTKNYAIKETQKHLFTRATKLAERLVSPKKETQTIKHRLVEKPVFTSLITNGTSTITNNYTPQGFYERTKNGKATGVFIALDDIAWYPSIRESDTILAKMRQQAIKNIKNVFNIDLEIIEEDNLKAQQGFYPPNNHLF